MEFIRNGLIAAIFASVMATLGGIVGYELGVSDDTSDISNETSDMVFCSKNEAELRKELAAEIQGWTRSHEQQIRLTEELHRLNAVQRILTGQMEELLGASITPEQKKMIDELKKPATLP